MQWGVNNEAEAVIASTNQTEIWLDLPGILGASPDGIVDEESILEAKCPYTERNMTIRESIPRPISA